MAYIQLKKFDQAKAGKVKNFCLANVTKGYGIPNKYASAWEAWQNTEQHEDGAPLGVDVPVYFSYFATIDGEYKNWGHIGVLLKNGKFWSDGVVYSSIYAYTSTHAPKYIGWGESVNEVKVIKGDDMYKNKTAKQWYEKFIAAEASLEKYKRVANERERIISTNPFKVAYDKIKAIVK